MFDNIEREESELLRENMILSDRVKFLEEQLKTVLKTEDVCQLLGIKEQTLGKWKKNNNFPYHKLGRTSPCYYIRKEIEEWICRNFK